MFSWVKNVYRRPYNWFKFSAISSPMCIFLNNITFLDDVKLPVVQLFMQFLNKFISTAKKSIYNLLICFYTHNPQHLLLEPLKIY